jgi:hypothetical protein
LEHTLRHGFATPADQQQQQQQQGPVLSAAAVRLVLELQLLVAAEYQRRQRQQNQAPTSLLPMLMVHSVMVLHTLIRAVAHARCRCLPPEVLQQAGLQLLQALAAPLQQLQLAAGNSLLECTQQLESRHMGEACHALVAAACGLARRYIDGEVPRSIYSTPLE